jgi:hypothetical protein
MPNLLRTALLVGELNLVRIRPIITLAVISPTIMYLQIELIPHILQIYQYSQVFSNLYGILQRSSLKNLFKKYIRILLN